MATFDIQDGVLVKAKGMDKVIIVPEGVTTIARRAFFENCDVKEIIFPEGVQKICSCAIEQCACLLERIVIPSTVTEIEPDAFLYSISDTCKIEIAEANPVYSSEGNCFIEKATGTLIMGHSDSVIPDGVITISAGAFSDCSMKEIVIPSSVKEIGRSAFSSCRDLKHIYISEGVEKIGEHALWGCDSLESIEVAENNPCYYSKGNCLIERATNILITGCYTSVIPDGVTKIEDWAFFHKGDLSEITIPGSVKEIGNAAFWQCHNLRHAEIREGVTKITHTAFWQCWSLESVTLPSTLTEIGERAFGEAPLKEIFIPAASTKIDPEAFSGCTGLKKIEVAEGNPVYQEKSGYLIEKATGMPIMTCNTKTLPSGITAISTALFSNNCELTEISVPDGVIEIRQRAFYGCRNLKKVTLPDSVKQIGVQAFAYCKQLHSIVLPKKLTDLYIAAFAECGLREITIPSSLREIDIQTFKYSDLERVVIQDGTIKIGEGAFEFCKNLESVLFPATLKEIGTRSFLGCGAMKEVKLHNGVTKIGEGAFAECLHLENITLPDTLIALGKNAFRECYMLKELTIPNSVTKIGKNLLRLTNLNTLTLPRRFESVISTLGVDTSKTKVIYTED